MLSQYDDEGVLHPVAYYSKMHMPAECDYDIYIKERMAVIKALKEWRPKCGGAAYPLQLLTDHKNLQVFIAETLLNRRQARWSKCSTRFDYQIVYRAGKLNGKLDALTRRPGDLPEGGDDRLKNMEQVVLNPENLPKHLCLLADSLPIQRRPSISDVMADA